MSWKIPFYRKRLKTETELIHAVEGRPIPKHIAIIMDGNGRWAKARKLPRSAGHRQGVEVLRDIISICSQIAIKHLTLFAFSTENWKRSEAEIQTLMSLLVEFLQKEIAELHEKGVKIWMLGDMQGLPEEATREIEYAIKLTKNNKGLQVNIALNYGSRVEIVRAAKNIAEDILKGRLTLNDITEECFSHYLYTDGIPDPDLLIRTSGEFRLSNFLLYQSAYTEFLFTKKQLLWPDFNRQKLLESILEYQNRSRRYGGITE
ncbi:MAG TPA: isoprenyl transferase [Clostridiales bacterium]|nr:isoprenyl transferase [Clostridia bacterium]MDD4680655.1 isoprenyl transferase [Clostridia bacterium]HCS75112.1 isoprenyl transferase [Clostridiales bacterium]